MCRWSLKGLAEQCKSQICFSYGHTMKGLTIISLLLVAIMVSTAAAQGNAWTLLWMNIDFVLHDFMLDLDHADDNTGIFFFSYFKM